MLNIEKVDDGVLEALQLSALDVVEVSGVCDNDI